MNSLIIISNEKFYMDEKACYCDNIDMKSTPEELSNIYEVLLIARKFNIKRAFKVDRSRFNVSLNTNVISYLLSILKTLKLKTKYLILGRFIEINYILHWNLFTSYKEGKCIFINCRLSL